MDLGNRFGVSEHNGGLVGPDYASSSLVDASRIPPLDFSVLVSEVEQNRGSAAALFAKGRVALEDAKAEFIRARNPEDLRDSLLRLFLVYLGFDHDAFFTLETRDNGIVNDVLRSGKVTR